MKLVMGNYLIEGSQLIGKYSKFNLYYFHEILRGKMRGNLIKRALWYDTSMEKCLRTIVQNKMQLETRAFDAESWISKYRQINEDMQKSITQVNETLLSMIDNNKQ